jgi:TonB family protein
MMTADAGMMDQHENVRGAFTRSVVLHLAVIGGLGFYAWVNGITDRFGREDAGGAMVGIQVIAPIPLPSHGPVNPVANDTDSDVPQEIAKPTPKAAPEPEPEDAVPILPPTKTSKQPLTPKSKLKGFDDIAKNQLTSKSPQAVSNPLFASSSGAGRINVGGDNTLGNRFPEYAAQIQELTRQNWHTEEVDRSVTSGPPVTIRFELQKDGRVRNVQLIRRSNIPTLDLSVQNAVEEAHYPPLPAGFERSSVPVEFTMVLKR